MFTSVLFADSSKDDVVSWLGFAVATAAFLLGFRNYVLTRQKNRLDATFKVYDRWESDTLFKYRQAIADWLPGYDKEQQQRLQEQFKNDVHRASKLDLTVAARTLLEMDLPGMASERYPDTEAFQLDVSKMLRGNLDTVLLYLVAVENMRESKTKSETRSKLESQEAAGLAMNRLAHFFADLSTLYVNGLLDKPLVRSLFGHIVAEWMPILRRLRWSEDSHMTERHANYTLQLAVLLERDAAGWHTRLRRADGGRTRETIRRTTFYWLGKPLPS